MGVRRAMEMVLAEINKGTQPLYTYGPLIHNRQVLALLETKGVTAADDIKDLDWGTIVIRAHGIPPHERRAIKASGLRIRDATCPRVARVQAIISSHTKQGYNAIIVGDKNHPEVKGLMGYAHGRVYAINGPEEIEKLPRLKKVFVVAQTTQSAQNFQEVVQAVKERIPEALIFDTICDATYNRQKEVRAFAGHVDGVVVVGGYNSGNTQRLVQISCESDMPTLHVETEKNIDKEKLADMEVVGVTAGASTPNWMIKGVVRPVAEFSGPEGEAALEIFHPKGKDALIVSLQNRHVDQEICLHGWPGYLQAESTEIHIFKRFLQDIHQPGPVTLREFGVPQNIIYTSCYNTKSLAMGRAFPNGDLSYTMFLQQDDHITNQSGGGVDPIERHGVLIIPSH